MVPFGMDFGSTNRKNSKKMKINFKSNFGGEKGVTRRCLGGGRDAQTAELRRGGSGGEAKAGSGRLSARRGPGALSRFAGSTPGPFFLRGLGGENLLGHCFFWNDLPQRRLWNDLSLRLLLERFVPEVWVPKCIR